MMDLCYIGSQTGERIDLMSGDFAAQNVEALLQNKWDYTSFGVIDNRAVIKSFRKDAEERKLSLQVLADDEEEFERIMGRMHRIFEADVRARSPGKLWCNGYCMDAFAIGDTHDEFDEMLSFVKKTVRFLLPSPFWTREIKHSFVSFANSGTGEIDFPVDFPFDLGRDEDFEFVENDTVGPSRFRMTIYGPCVDPSVTLAGHAYGFDGLTIAAGAYAVVDAKEKTAYLVGTNGQRTNVFDLRDRSSYIFEPIPTGNVAVVRQRSLAFDLVVYDERGLPPWT